MAISGSSIRWHNRDPAQTQAIPIVKQHAAPGSKPERPNVGPIATYLGHGLGWSLATFVILGLDFLLAKVLVMLYHLLFS